MVSGYKILWTDHALIELADTYEYLVVNFTERELKQLSAEIDKTLRLIAQNPSLFPLSESRGIHRAIVKKYNTIYYREKKGYVEILSFFSNRQNPNKIKL
ncbi:type II toxin-antitoxin system RelE/ParE family toxin [Hyunsoonleella sp. 2307UL5-6]|uniref:type II toxin-antitoxin system RelE/ParE family toxin n=1 Tax=Hyunsoonleella sp. 2307UL5-6 TaxID=3384768 RepID=UPI0039BD85BA